MIAEIAVIARNRRDRKGKTLPLMNADTTDQAKECQNCQRSPKLEGKNLTTDFTDNTDQERIE